MSYYVIIPYSYIMRMLYEKEVFLLLVVFGVGTQQTATLCTFRRQSTAIETRSVFSSATHNGPVWRSMM